MEMAGLDVDEWMGRTGRETHGSSGLYSTHLTLRRKYR
jgi:hypothetical protein